eukprot:jgi/Botrbrau1/1240/Bobra.0163s0033.1
MTIEVPASDGQPCKPIAVRQLSVPLGSLKRVELSSAELQALTFPNKKSNSEDANEQKLSKCIEEIYVHAEETRLQEQSGSLLTALLDISPILQDAGAAMVDDTFLRCFQSAPSDNWNWNLYLFPLWLFGVILRHFILFPIRLIQLLGGFALFFIMFFSVKGLIRDPVRKLHYEQVLVQFMCNCFTASWTAVIRYHGPKPIARQNHVWVCNHTSMIDYIILCAYRPFAVIMQLHPGWVGFLQTQVLNCLGCLWFNRTEVTDRQLVAARMKKHVQTEGSVPLLIFPEGTCVNNEYCVMFKRGAFDLGATVCPIAIKYNKIFVDAFWNSKRQSFTSHLVTLMNSWAVVCDVYFLEPQTQWEGESSKEFAERVQKLIAERANLTVAPWDGYLKYYQLGDKHPDLIEKRRKVFADKLRGYIDEHDLLHVRSEGTQTSTPSPDWHAANGIEERLRQRAVRQTS